MNAVLKVNFDLGDEARKARLLEAGEKLNRSQTVEYDLGSATPAERQAIVNYAGVELRDITIVVWTNSTWDEREPKSDKILLDGIPTLSQVAGYCIQMTMERERAQTLHDEVMRQKVLEDIEAKTATIRKCLAEGTLDSRGVKLAWGQSLANARQRLEIDTSEYDTLYAGYQALEQKRNAEIEREHEAYEAQKTAEKAARKAEKLTWVEANGSDHLRRACAAGHDCSRLYWIERAALEYPGYVVDIENTGTWKSRSCPSIEALDERDAILKAHPEAECEIGWSTEMPRANKATGYDDYNDYEEYEECEIIVVKDQAYPYDLEKLM